MIFLDITPALFVHPGGQHAYSRWRRYRRAGLVNPVSDLPNLNALRINSRRRNQALIAARVLNYEEIVATLPPSSERQLIEQIVSRLNVGAPDRTLYQGDGGIFAWFEQSRCALRQSSRCALIAVPKSGARGGTFDRPCDSVRGRSRKRPFARKPACQRPRAPRTRPPTRASSGNITTPNRSQNASWKLSMLSQLDEAIDRGEVWVAYQPKLDIGSRRIVGAEALARWTHPEKGPIAASEFVAAAEQHNRIGKLTDFVLEKAVAAAAQINKRGPVVHVAVNLSARLLTDKGFTLRLSALLARHGLSPSRLILELTETAALADSGEALDMINRFATSASRSRSTITAPASRRSTI